MNINDWGAIAYAIIIILLLTNLTIFLWKCDDGEELKKIIENAEKGVDKP